MVEQLSRQEDTNLMLDGGIDSRNRVGSKSGSTFWPDLRETVTSSIGPHRSIEFVAEAFASPHLLSQLSATLTPQLQAQYPLCTFKSILSVYRSLHLRPHYTLGYSGLDSPWLRHHRQAV